MATITDSFKQTKSKGTASVGFKHESKVFLTSTVNETESNELAILKSFDMQAEYGPCLGITRLERWERAEKFDLNPPAKVKEIIQAHINDEVYKECLWKKYDI